MSELVGGFFTNPSWRICPLNWVHLPQGSGFWRPEPWGKKKGNYKSQGDLKLNSVFTNSNLDGFFAWTSGAKIKVIQVSKTKIQVQSDQNMVAYIGKPRDKVYICLYIHHISKISYYYLMCKCIYVYQPHLWFGVQKSIFTTPRKKTKDRLSPSTKRFTGVT